MESRKIPKKPRDFDPLERDILLKTMQYLKKKKHIVDYQILKKNGSFVEFLMKMKNNRSFRVNFFSSNSSIENSIEITKDSDMTIELFLGKITTHKFIRTILLAQMKKLYAGLNLEIDFLKKVENGILDSGQEKYHIIDIRKSLEEEDQYRGIDFFITTDYGEIPLQIKHYNVSLDNHWKKYPKIPVLRHHKKTTQSVLFQKISLIIREYKKGNIIEQ